MYIWKVKKLSSDLRNNRVTEKEKFKYILFWALATLLSSDPALFIGLEYTITSIMLVVLTIMGTNYCYFINKTGDNNDFITRYVCLSVPIGIRVVILFFCILVVFGVVEYFLELGLFGHEEAYATTAFQVLLLSLFVTWFYYYLGNAFKSTAYINA